MMISTFGEICEPTWIPQGDEAALVKELHDTIDRDRDPFCERIRTLKTILAKLRPEPVCVPEDVCAAASNGREKTAARSGTNHR
jgi:hypothetical protein